MYVRELGIHVWAMVIDDSPCLLSMSRLYWLDGFSYIQKGAEPPYLVKEDVKVVCQIVFDVPYLTPATDTVAGGDSPLEPAQAEDHNFNLESQT